MKKEIKALNVEKVRELAPSIFSTSVHNGMSNKYKFYNTATVMNELMEKKWEPVSVNQVKRRGGSQGTQKHLVRFQREDLCYNDEFVELVMVNSHDGRSPFKLMAGIYRLACSNGLIIGDTYQAITIRHTGHTIEDVLDESNKLVRVTPKLHKLINRFKEIEVNERYKKVFANTIMKHIYTDPKLYPFDSVKLLNPRREVDKKSDLWTVMNVVQENVMKGKLSGSVIDKNGMVRKVKTKKIKGIWRTVNYNQMIWNNATKLGKFIINNS